MHPQRWEHGSPEIRYDAGGIPMTQEEKNRIDQMDEEAAVMRFVDQPGQWEDVTPEDVRKRQAEAWKEYVESVKR